MPHKDPEARRAYQARYEVKSRRHRPPRQCAVCERTFTPYDTGSNRSRYCSTECAEASKRALHLGPPEPLSTKDKNQNGPMGTFDLGPGSGAGRIKTCAVCGKCFTYTLRKLYCSAECERAKRNEVARERYARDPEKALERQRKWRERDPEAWRAYCREKGRKWRKNHPEHTSTEACRKWRAKKRAEARGHIDA